MTIPSLPIIPPKVEAIANLFGQALGLKEGGTKTLASSIAGLPDLVNIIENLPIEVLKVSDFAKLLQLIQIAPFSEDMSDLVRSMIDSVMNTPQARETAEVFGSVIMGPFLSLMTEYAYEGDNNPEDFAAAFHGLNIMLTIPQFAANLLQGSAVGTVLGRISQGFTSIYWNLGLGFLGWQTLAPFLSAGLQPRLERHYAAKFLPKRFDLSTLIYLYNIHEMTAAELLNNAKELGWKPAYVQTILNESYKTLSDSEIKSFYNAGIMTLEDVRLELARQGTNPKYINQTVKDILNSESNKDKSPTLTQARKAFKLNLRSEAEFRNMLKLLGYGQQAIDLEIAIIRSEQRDDNRQLTNSQIREAYVQGALERPEVVTALIRDGYSLDDTNVLLDTWDAAKKPKVLKLNQGTIKLALTNGVINTSKALSLLTYIGYSRDDAQLIIDTALATLKLARPKVAISQLITALSLKIISQTEFTTEAQARNYSQSDIQIMVGLANRSDVLELSVSDIQQAFIYRAIDEQSALNELVQLGSSQADAQLRLNTWKNQQANLRQRPSVGQWITFYRQKLVSADTFQRAMQDLGLTPTEAQLLVKSADLAFPRELSSYEIQQQFTTGVINADRATSLLKNTGLSQENAQNLVQAWGQMLGYNTPTASISNLITAYQNEIISKDEYIQALREKGYPQKTIEFYVKLADAPAIQTTKELTKSDIEGLYHDEFLEYEEALDRLIKLGYNPDDAELLLSRKRPAIKDLQVTALFRQGQLDPQEYIDILLSKGYSLNDIENYLDSIGA